MPVITIEGPPIGNIDTRRKMVADLTSAAASAYNMPPEKIIILIRETNPDQVAVAGELISDRK